jgi:hypothetical protein
LNFPFKLKKENLSELANETSISLCLARFNGALVREPAGKRTLRNHRRSSTMNRPAGLISIVDRSIDDKTADMALIFKFDELK